MSIRAQLLLVLAAVAALLLPTSALDVLSSLDHLATIRRAAELNDATDQLLAASRLLARERGQTRMLVSSVLAQRPAPRDNRAEVRAQTDASILKAINVFRVLADGATQQIGLAFELLSDISPKLKLLRQEADRIIADRAASAVGFKWHVGMDDLIAQQQQAAKLLRNSVTGQLAASLSRGLDMKEALWEMVETLGRERALISPLLEAERRPAPEDLQALGVLKGRLEYEFVTVKDGQLYLGKPYQRRVDITARALHDYEAARAQQLAAGLAGNAYPFSPFEWSRRTADLIEDVTATQRVATDEVTETVAEEQRWTTYGLVAAAARLSTALALLAFGAFVIISRVTAPIGRVTSALRRLTAGDANVPIDGLERMDEIGAMAKAVQAFKETLVRGQSLEKQASDARIKLEGQKAAAMREMADVFETALVGFVDQVVQASANLQATAHEMAAAARHVATRSKDVETTSEQAAVRFEVMGRSAEGLGTFVSEVGRRVGASEELAHTAAGAVTDATACAEQLSQATAKIDDIATMIASIAGQTNLLALNATIEAARAGTAGRGFAVVANEVKDLASATAKATEVITSEVQRIEASTHGTVAAVEVIGSRVADINGDARRMAAAVDEQIDSTRLILENVRRAALETGDVRRNIADVAQAARAGEGSAQDVLSSATRLAERAKSLSGEVAGFLAHLRAA